MVKHNRENKQNPMIVNWKLVAIFPVNYVEFKLNEINMSYIYLYLRVRHTNFVFRGKI